MGKALTQDQKDAFEIAALLDDVADQIQARSKQAYLDGKLLVDEYQAAIVQQLELRSHIAVIVAMNLSDILKQTSEAEANIQDAIAQAKKKIEDIQSLKKSLGVLAAVITLAAAISNGNIAAIVGATKVLIKASKGPKPQ